MQRESCKFATVGIESKASGELIVCHEAFEQKAILVDWSVNHECLVTFKTWSCCHALYKVCTINVSTCHYKRYKREFTSEMYAGCPRKGHNNSTTLHQQWGFFLLYFPLFRSLLVYSRKNSAFSHYDSSGTYNEDAARQIAKKMQPHVAPGERVKFIQESAPQQQNGLWNLQWNLVIKRSIIFVFASELFITKNMFSMVMENHGELPVTRDSRGHTACRAFVDGLLSHTTSRAINPWKYLFALFLPF